MLPDSHEILYRKLAEITDRVCFALKETDPEVLMLLAAEQNTVAQDLQKAGTLTDARLLEQAQALSRQVADVISVIHQRQSEISIRIKQLSDGRKMVQAYAT